MSRRDLSHIMNALWDRSGGQAGLGVPVGDIDTAIGRGRGDMRTPLNLQSLADDGRTTVLPDGTWALTEAGVAWLQQERDLSGR
jgi:hypothetical protein